VSKIIVDYAFLLFRIGIGLMFVISSIPKLIHPYDFLSHIYKYEMLGPTAALFLASILPALELVIGACLIGGIFIEGTLLMASVLLAVFSVAELSVLLRGLEMSCGCFSVAGAGAGKISYLTALRTLSLCLLAGLTYFRLSAAKANRHLLFSGI
jgi:uncharacterized membrane protein YphA (DoxX/SURF4 family)